MTSIPYFDIIYAIGPFGEFGLKNRMPWGRIKEDLQFFKKITTDTQGKKNCMNAIVMGKGTFESMKSKPLPGRYNVIISSSLVTDTISKNEISDEKTSLPNYDIYPTLEVAMNSLASLVKLGKIYKVFIIGGSELIKTVTIMYGQTHCEYVHITEIIPCDKPDFEADHHLQINFPNIFHADSVASENITDNTDRHYNLIFKRYTLGRPNHPENSIIKLMKKIMEEGRKKSNRTRITSLSLWHESLRIPMSKYGFPLETGRKMFWRGIVEELLFFLTGKTQSKILSNKGVKIWEGNTSREFLDKLGFTNWEEGEMGASYGFHWRHFGAERRINEQLELGQGGIDQIAQIIEQIKAVKADSTRDEARRLIVTAWNPSQLKQVALPSCHFCFQFEVYDGELNCLVNMRSSDVFIGLGWNIAFYALLNYMIAHLVGLTPGTLVMSLADVHIYENHIEQVKEQISRPPREWPTLTITGSPKNIDDFTSENFVLENYQPHPGIKGEMAV